MEGGLPEIEEKRNELVPEHQRMQKRSQKMPSIQDKKRNLLKEACACDEEMRKVGEEISEREARYLELSNKSTNNRMAVEEGGEKKVKHRKKRWWKKCEEIILSPFKMRLRRKAK